MNIQNRWERFRLKFMLTGYHYFVTGIGFVTAFILLLFLVPFFFLILPRFFNNWVLGVAAGISLSGATMWLGYRFLQWESGLPLPRERARTLVREEADALRAALERFGRLLPRDAEDYRSSNRLPETVPQLRVAVEDLASVQTDPKILSQLRAELEEIERRNFRRRVFDEQYASPLAEAELLEDEDVPAAERRLAK